MNRTQFQAVCDAAKIPTFDAGRDWHDAGVRGTYLVASLADKSDFDAIKPLLEKGIVKLGIGRIRAGHGWYEFNPVYHSSIEDTADGISAQCASDYAVDLGHRHDVTYYSRDDITTRDHLLTENPARDGENADEHFARVDELAQKTYNCLPPLYVNAPGHWDNAREDCLLSDADRQSGIWCYDDGDVYNWSVLAVFNDEQCESGNSEDE